jgi:hypothetical protein
MPICHEFVVRTVGIGFAKIIKEIQKEKEKKVCCLRNSK